MHESDDALRAGEVPETLMSAEYRVVLEKIRHLHSLMTQHDKLTELAITKSENTTNERFAKANEFREQQKDIIAQFARQKEVYDLINALSDRVDNSIASATARYEANVKTSNDKIETLSVHLSEKIEMTRKGIDEKRETLYAGILSRFDDIQKNFNGKLENGLKTVDDKITANLRAETARFTSVDVSMETKINANAEISNNGISEINRRLSGYSTREEVKALADKIEGLQRLVYIGIGILLVLEFLSKYIIK